MIFPIDAALDGARRRRRGALEPWDLAVISHSTGQAGTLVPRDVSTAGLVFLATLLET